MRVEEVVEFGLRGKKCCGSGGKTCRQKSAYQREKQFSADGNHRKVCVLGFEQITNTAHGLDSAVGKLFSEMMDVHFNSIGANGVVPVVELFLKLRAAPDDALTLSKCGKKRILF